MKELTPNVIYSVIEYFRFKKENLTQELYFTNNMLNELEQLPVAASFNLHEKKPVDWEKEVAGVVNTATSPLTKLAIAKSIEAKLKYPDHRLAMLCVSGALYNLRKEIKKVKVGNSYRYMSNS
jgi:hypothetical protein